MEEAGKVVRAAAEEGVAQADTPEMRMVGEKVRAGASATAEGASNVAGAIKDTAVNAKDTVKDTFVNAKESVKSTAHDVSYRAREKVDDVRDAAYNFKEEVKVRAEAVGESGRRARAAPRRVGHELKEAFASWRRGLATSLGLMALIGVIAITTWILLTIALVVALNKLLFDPLGTFLVVVLYAVIAGIAWAVRKSRMEAAQRETRRRMDRSKEEIRYVGRPVREAFAGRGRAGF